MDSIYQRYDLQEVINASGRMTILGVSTPRPEVAEAVTEGLNHFFNMKQLVDHTGEHIARLLQVESALIVSCASAGIAQSVAAVICQDDDELLINLHGSQKAVPREIVMPKGHNVNFGAPVDTMVMLGGGKVVEAGYANECT
ncbi:MAG: SelA-like pyridoxal phosphate-dependent enzyme, partial [Enterobacteriaceae bacterium]